MFYTYLNVLETIESTEVDFYTSCFFSIIILFPSILASSSSFILKGNALSFTKSLGRLMLCLLLCSYTLTVALFTIEHTLRSKIYNTFVSTSVHTKIHILRGAYTLVHTKVRGVD